MGSCHRSRRATVPSSRAVQLCPRHFSWPYRSESWTVDVWPCSYKACLPTKGGCGFFSPSSAAAMLVDELYLAGLDLREPSATLQSLLAKTTGA